MRPSDSPCASHSPRVPSPPSWCTSPAPIPVNLHVCHESRVEARRHYALMFGIARRPGHVFFDPARDVLYFGPRDGFMAAEAQLRTMLALADPDELAQVQRVAVSATVLGDGFSQPFQSSSSASTNLAVDVLHLLRAKLPRLKELVVIPHDGHPTYDTDTVLVPLPLLPTSLPLGPISSWPIDGPSACAGDGSLHRQNQPDNSNTSGVDSGASAASENTACLARQVHAAMRRVCAAVPDWKPPRWRILAISSEPVKQLRCGKLQESESESEEDLEIEQDNDTDDSENDDSENDDDEQSVKDPSNQHKSLSSHCGLESSASCCRGSARPMCSFGEPSRVPCRTKYQKSSC
ncbi:hypothetical protein SBRCBS47491_000154 [Sporothrix bragantina]|uniref:2EXR domain-containing protein n=1 Tax=Sporothrix bragantina TaxID=671064 RepID=A0ABP0AMZ9_9PEZI